MHLRNRPEGTRGSSILNRSLLVNIELGERVLLYRMLILTPETSFLFSTHFEEGLQHLPFFLSHFEDGSKPSSSLFLFSFHPPAKGKVSAATRLYDPANRGRKIYEA